MGRTDDDAWEWLYTLTAAGMWAFTHARFRVDVTTGLPRLSHGDVWVATHREETDVPLLGGLLLSRGGMWRPGNARIHFAARDDLFAPGVVAAGLRLPRLAARAVWGLSPGPWLPRVRAHPVRRPTGAKLGQVLVDAGDGDLLQEVVTERVLGLIGARARQLGRRMPLTVPEMRGPDYARVLWEDVDGADFAPEAGTALWRRHIVRAAGDLRRLVAVVRDGHPLMLFAEGRVSPDGAIGPVGEILRVVARHGRPRRIVPVGLAYDPLTQGRTTIALGVGAPVDPAEPDVVAVTEQRLRAATPLTCGQVVARWLAAGDPSPLRDYLDACVARARDTGRPLARDLTRPAGRDRRLASALRALEARGIPFAEPDRARGLADAQVARLAREAHAAWGGDGP